MISVEIIRSYWSMASTFSPSFRCRISISSPSGVRVVSFNEKHWGRSFFLSKNNKRSECGIEYSWKTYWRKDTHRSFSRWCWHNIFAKDRSVRTTSHGQTTTREHFLLSTDPSVAYFFAHAASCFGFHTFHETFSHHTECSDIAFGNLNETDRIDGHTTEKRCWIS